MARRRRYRFADSSFETASKKNAHGAPGTEPSFASIKGRGHVGRGIVTRATQPAVRFIPGSENKPLFELPLMDLNMSQASGEEEAWAVDVRWIDSRDRGVDQWLIATQLEGLVPQIGHALERYTLCS